MIYAFGDFELDEERYELRRTGVPIKLEPKAFRVLAYLIQHRGRVLTGDELRERFWPGEFVTDSALAHCIVKARQAADDAGVPQRAIKTVHGHGYRFIADVITCSPNTAPPAGPPLPQPLITAEASSTLEAPDPVAQLPQTGHRLPEGERKEVTVLSAAVKGIPALAQALDPEVFPAVLRQFLDLMRMEVQRAEGRLNLVTGKALRAVFGVPIAHEDHALRALHAALGLRQAFAAFAADLRRTQGIILTVRVGLHAGPVVVSAIGSAGHTDGTALGFTSDLADGLQQFVKEDTIYVSEAVRRHSEGFFRFKDLGACALLDIAQPVRVYECTGVNQVHTRLEAFLRRHLSAFRGREREIDLLKSLWTRAYGSQGQVVCLFGEAGVGKSRLAYEFQRTLAEACALQVQAFSSGQEVPYHPITPSSPCCRPCFSWAATALHAANASRSVLNGWPPTSTSRSRCWPTMLGGGRYGKKGSFICARLAIKPARPMLPRRRWHFTPMRLRRASTWRRLWTQRNSSRYTRAVGSSGCCSRTMMPPLPIFSRCARWPAPPATCKKRGRV